MLLFPFIIPISLLLLSPVLIARIARLTGRFRLPVMLSLIVVAWGLTLLSIFGLQFGGVELISNLASNLLIAIVIIILTTYLGNVLSRLIARRYAISVADALATIIAGTTTSVIMPALTIYLFAADYLATSPPSQTITTDLELRLLSFNIRTMIVNFILLGTASGVTAYLLMGPGTISVLRQRKATIVASLSVGLALFYSFVLSIGMAQVASVFTSVYSRNPSIEGFNATMIPLLAGSYTMILLGLLTAGLTVGVFEEVAIVLDSLAITIALVLLFFFVQSSISALASERATLLVLLLLYSVIQVHAFMLGNNITTLYVMLIQAIFFLVTAVYMFFVHGSSFLSLLLLLFVFVFMQFVLIQMGITLRSVKFAGYITTALFIFLLILIPVVLVFS